MAGAWIDSLGYTNFQPTPKWTNPAEVTYNTPIGTEVYIYCDNVLKRPRKDEWDANSEDGMISTTCVHGGVYSISMNPADWDRCRRKCPAEKPKPPVVPVAQLISFDTEPKQQRHLWEDEMIL